MNNHFIIAEAMNHSSMMQFSFCRG